MFCTASASPSLFSSPSALTPADSLGFLSNDEVWNFLQKNDTQKRITITLVFPPPSPAQSTLSVESLTLMAVTVSIMQGYYSPHRKNAQLFPDFSRQNCKQYIEQMHIY